ncbi:hypothetical protein GCM10020219_035380 [Nonomuraea dietziae]
MRPAPTAVRTAQPTFLASPGAGSACPPVTGCPASPRSSISPAITVSTGTERKTHRQPSVSTTRPTIAGPTMEGTTHAVANREKIFGCDSSG